MILPTLIAAFFAGMLKVWDFPRRARMASLALMLITTAGLVLFRIAYLELITIGVDTCR